MAKCNWARAMQAGVLCSVALAASLFAGCGKKPVGGKAVTGQVTYNGVPVAGATVTFLSPSGTPGFAMTDAEGKYSARTSQGPGLPAGSYQVTVTKIETGEPQNTVSEQDPAYVPPGPDAPPPAPPKDLLPAKYKSPDSSGLTATVGDSGQNEFSFPLTD